MKMMVRQRVIHTICAVYRPCQADLEQTRSCCSFDCAEGKMKPVRIGPEGLSLGDFRHAGRVFLAIAPDPDTAIDLVRQYLSSTLGTSADFVTDLELDAQALEQSVLPPEPPPYEFDFITFLEPLFQLELQNYRQLETFYELCRSLYTTG